jgi:hypothetical protein
LKRGGWLVYFERNLSNAQKRGDLNMADIGLAWVNPAPLTKPENVVNFAKNCEAMGC